MFLFVIRIAVVALVVYVIWRVLRPRYAVRIVMDEHGILCWSSDFCAARMLMGMAPNFVIPCFPSIKTRRSGRTR